MAKPYDNGMRRLMEICAQDFLDWLNPGAFFTGKMSEKFESVEIEADAMHETILCDKKALVHFEFQSGPDKNMARRLLEYLILAYRRYKCPVTSYVIYLKDSPNIPTPPLVLTRSDGEEILRLNYKVIKVYETPYEVLLAMGLKGLLPVIPLAAGGAKREVIEEVIRRLLPGHDTISKELLALVRLFASLAFDKNDVENQEWLQRRFIVLQDIFRDTPAYQYILEEGREEGREEGIQKGQIEALRRAVVQIVLQRFPKLVRLAREKVAFAEDSDILLDLIGKLSVAADAENAKQCLLAIDESLEDLT
jgi:predicted transposase YdaD